MVRDRDAQQYMSTKHSLLIHGSSMSKIWQQRTKAVYEDPQIVKGYIGKHSVAPKMFKVIDSFAREINGKQVLDLGCGPGQDSYCFSKLGFNVTGMDYSSEMIKAAQQLQTVNNPPQFIVGDMREIITLFSPNTFDAVWASASLLHIPQNDISVVLNGIHSITKNDGRVFIAVKQGEQGERVVAESKYGKPMKREFTFWEKNNLERLLLSTGFIIEKSVEQTQKQNDSTTWLNFFLRVGK